jgi:hypothetical protein
MMAFAAQVGALLLVAFVVGCAGGCWLRRSLSRRQAG